MPTATLSSARGGGNFTMKRVWKLALLVSIGVCVAAWAGMAAAESEEAGQELQNYFSNANVDSAGNALVNITAPFEGNATSPTGSVANGETCAMIYVFDTSQAMEECCGCPITADGLLTISITDNLAQQPVGDSVAGINSLEKARSVFCRRRQLSVSTLGPRSEERRVG